MGSYKQLTGMQTSPNRPDRVKPVPDTPKGPSFPYRGTETHGVAPTGSIDYDQYYETQVWDDGPDEIPVLKPEEEPEPVPVRIVQGSARERLEWRATRLSVNGDGPALQLVGRHDKRRSLRIRVHGDTDPLYIGSDNNVRPYTGYLVPAGTELMPVYSTEEVYATAEPGTTVEVSVMYEYGVEL